MARSRDRFCSLLAAGCILLPKETRYLLSAKGRANQQDVRQHLGRPDEVTRGRAGDAWTYHVREFVQGGNNTWSMSGSWWCDTYTLRFDAEGILRHWDHESHTC
jgi:hypothetical protein